MSAAPATGMGMAALSVVVPSVTGLADLVGCLEALEAQRRDVVLEVLVVERLGDGVREEVRRRFPLARVLPVPPTTTIPRMRELAFEAATAPMVAVIEDHVIVPAGWARRLLDAQRAASNGTAAVVGGAVENAATSKLSEWAAFLCEYSHAIPPLPSGPAEWLLGNNVVYPRALLERYRPVIAEGKWENALHDAFRRDGIPLVCRPDIVVGHKMHWTLRQYLSQRYLYARSYAGARVKGSPLPTRLAYAAAALALPPLLFYRTLARVVAKGRHRRELVRSIPLLALFVTSWAVGEVVGYSAGPGDSLEKVC